MPAQASIQSRIGEDWIPAFAGMTDRELDQAFGPPRETPTLAGRSIRSPIV